VPPLRPRLKMTPAVGPTQSAVEEKMNGMRQGQNCPFTCAGEGMCKRNFQIGENWLKTPESKSSRASGLNFKRLVNLGLYRVRPAKIGLNFKIPHSSLPTARLLFFSQAKVIVEVNFVISRWEIYVCILANICLIKYSLSSKLLASVIFITTHLTICGIKKIYIGCLFYL
jgi:hypothetical protein